MKNYLFLFLICSSIIYSQQNDFIEFFSDKGFLTITDDQKGNFGRYDGFEMYLNADENLYFMAYSTEFPPIVTVADSAGNIIAEDSDNADGLVSLNTKIKSSGTYFLYVLNRTNSVGEYLFQYAISPEAMLNISSKDFCGLTEFILNHAKAYFVFLQNPKNQLGNSQLFLDANLEEENALVNLRLFESGNKKEADTKLKSILNEIKKCGLSKWKETKKLEKDNSDFDESKIMFTEKVEFNPRIIELNLFDFSKQKDNSSKKYIIELSFRKTF